MTHINTFYIISDGQRHRPVLSASGKTTTSRRKSLGMSLEIEENHTVSCRRLCQRQALKRQESLIAVVPRCLVVVVATNIARKTVNIWNVGAIRETA